MQVLNVKPSKTETKRENTFLPNVLRHPKQHCFLEGSQASHVCPSGKSDIQMKMSMNHRWNDDRETRSTVRKPRPSATFSTTNLTWTDLEPKQSFRSKKAAIKRVINNLNNT